MCEYLSSLAPFDTAHIFPKNHGFDGLLEIILAGVLGALWPSHVLFNFRPCQCPINNLQAFSGACCILNRSQIAFGNIKKN